MSNQNSIPLFTVKQFCEKNPAFTHVELGIVFFMPILMA